MTAPVAGNQIVIGIGNPDRGDDAVGFHVAQLLRDRLPDAIEVAAHDGEPAALLARLDGAAAAFLVDACASGVSPGSVRRFDVAAAPLPQGMCGLSTHGFSVAATIELARALGQLPARCVVYAIEGGSFEIGAPLSAPLRAAAEDVVRELKAELCGHPSAKEEHHAQFD